MKYRKKISNFTEHSVNVTLKFPLCFEDDVPFAAAETINNKPVRAASRGTRFKCLLEALKQDLSKASSARSGRACLSWICLSFILFGSPPRQH